MFLLSTLVLCVHTCLTASSVPYAPWLPGHVLPFSVLFRKHTEKSHSSVLWSSTWPAACWLAVELEPLTVTGALTPAFLVPWSRPSRQVGCREQYYCKTTQGQTKSWVAGRGCWFSSLCGFVVVWFCHCCFTSILKNAEEMKWAVKFTGAHFTVFAGDDWIQMTLLSVSSFVKFCYRWRRWRIMCVEVFTKVLSVPIV